MKDTLPPPLSVVWALRFDNAIIDPYLKYFTPRQTLKLTWLPMMVEQMDRGLRQCTSDILRSLITQGLTKDTPYCSSSVRTQYGCLYEFNGWAILSPYRCTTVLNIMLNSTTKYRKSIVYGKQYRNWGHWDITSHSGLLPHIRDHTMIETIEASPLTQNSYHTWGIIPWLRP